MTVWTTSVGLVFFTDDDCDLLLVAEDGLPRFGLVDIGVVHSTSSPPFALSDACCF